MLSPYTAQHIDTLVRLEEELTSLEAEELACLTKMLGPYLAYREETGRFFREHLAAECGRICFARDRSGCCGREGIIVFFADFAVELLTTGDGGSENLKRALASDRGGKNCVYLGGEGGCLWRTKPIACEMFLCDVVQEKVFGADEGLKSRWGLLREREKSFTRPDRPVLFDDLERSFIERGLVSPLMYFHHSPGLLRLKRKHRVGRLERIAVGP